MKVPQGHVISQQAWALRRMISTYNAITRRPHIPRERVLRRIMANQGLDVPIDIIKPSSSSCSVGDGPNREPEPDPSDSSDSSGEDNTTNPDEEWEEESEESYTADESTLLEFNGKNCSCIFFFGGEVDLQSVLNSKKWLR